MVVIRDDVVSWHEFHREEESGTVYDEHNQYDASAVSAPPLSTDAPSTKFLGSYDLDGTNDYFTIADNNDFDFSTAVSYCIWFKTDSTGTRQIIIGKNGAYQLEMTSGNEIRNIFVSGSGNSDLTTSGVSISADTWYHIAVTYDGSNVKIYVNGTEEATASYSNSISATANNVGVGARGDGALPLNGHICGTNFFNKGLSSTEVGSNYNSGDGVTYRSFFDLEDNAYTWYKYDGNANDAVGNSNGTVTGATSGAQGRIGSAYSFDGTNDVIDTNVQIQDIEGAGGAFTYGMWLKKDNTSLESPIGESGTTYYFNWYIRPSDNLWGVGLYNGTSLTNYQDNPSGITTGDWHYFCITYDGSTLKKYLDGVEVGSHSATVDLSGVTDTVVHGRRQTGSPIWFTGDIDEPHHFQRALSPGEVRRLYSFGAGLRYEDLDNESFLIDGVAAAYNFNGDVADDKNSTFDATNNGTTTATGILDDARSFDGTNDFVDFDTFASNFDFANTTMGFWMKTSETDRDWMWGGRDDDNTPRMDIRLNADSSQSLDAGKMSFLMDDDSSGREQWGTTNDITFNNGSWHSHIVFWGGSAITYAYDGVDEPLTANSSTGVTSVNYVTQSPYIGGFNNYGSLLSPSNIDVDEVVFWNRELSSTEWNAWHNGGSGVQFPFFTAAAPPEEETFNSLAFHAGI